MLSRMQARRGVATERTRPRVTALRTGTIHRQDHRWRSTRMTSSAAPIPFAGSMLGEYRHVCAFFSSPQEEYATLLPFVRDGLERGERAYHIVPSEHRSGHLEQLRRAGIDVEGAQQRHQLDVVTSEETYLRGGHFSMDGMLGRIEEALKTGAMLGFPLTRLLGHPESVLEDLYGVNEFIEYETRLMMCCRITMIRSSVFMTPIF